MIKKTAFVGALMAAALVLTGCSSSEAAIEEEKNIATEEAIAAYEESFSEYASVAELPTEFAYVSDFPLTVITLRANDLTVEGEFEFSDIAVVQAWAEAKAAAGAMVDAQEPIVNPATNEIDYYFASVNAAEGMVMIQVVPGENGQIVTLAFHSLPTIPLPGDDMAPDADAIVEEPVTAP